MYVYFHEHRSTAADIRRVSNQHPQINILNVIKSSPTTDTPLTVSRTLLETLKVFFKKEVNWITLFVVVVDVYLFLCFFLQLVLFMECGAAGVPGLLACLQQRHEEESVTTPPLETTASRVEGTRCRRNAAETSACCCYNLTSMYSVERFWWLENRTEISGWI